MATISKKYKDESGREIILLEAQSLRIADTFSNVSYIIKAFQADEYHLTINGKTLVFGPKTSSAELMSMYKNPDYQAIPLHVPTLSKEEIYTLEYDVKPFDTNVWTPDERLQALHSQLDNALLLHQIEWAKEIHRSIQFLEESERKGLSNH